LQGFAEVGVIGGSPTEETFGRFGCSSGGALGDVLAGTNGGTAAFLH